MAFPICKMFISIHLS
uniref:Uncharacterized protein n=1 Tax=Anguilla anguilla TaxID=7936 RepID=A0A0E9RZV3_ANGAN